MESFVRAPRKLEYHRNTNSVPLNEEKQILKLISDLEKKKRQLQEWEEFDRDVKLKKVRTKEASILVFFGCNAVCAQIYAIHFAVVTRGWCQNAAN